MMVAFFNIIITFFQWHTQASVQEEKNCVGSPKNLSVILVREKEDEERESVKTVKEEETC